MEVMQTYTHTHAFECARAINNLSMVRLLQVNDSICTPPTTLLLLLTFVWLYCAAAVFRTNESTIQWFAQASNSSISIHLFFIQARANLRSLAHVHIRNEMIASQQYSIRIAANEWSMQRTQTNTSNKTRQKRTIVEHTIKPKQVVLCYGCAAQCCAVCIGNILPIQGECAYAALYKHIHVYSFHQLSLVVFRCRFIFPSFFPFSYSHFLIVFLDVVVVVVVCIGTAFGSLATLLRHGMLGYWECYTSSVDRRLRLRKEVSDRPCDFYFPCIPFISRSLLLWRFLYKIQFNLKPKSYENYTN